MYMRIPKSVFLIQHVGRYDGADSTMSFLQKKQTNKQNNRNQNQNKTKNNLIPDPNSVISNSSLSINGAKVCYKT